MATKYARTAGGNWNADATWSTSSGGAADTTAPTSADDVILDASSGNVTINVAAACRSLDCNAFTGTLTHASAVTLSIGDGTAGTGNRALRLSASMTYTLNNTATSAISLVSTSTTQQTIVTAGKNMGPLTINGAGGSWILSDGFSQNNTTIGVTLTAGTFNTNGQTCQWGLFSSSNANVRTLTLGASAITITGGGIIGWTTATSTNLTLNAGTSTITFTGGSVSGSFGTPTYATIVFAGSGAATINNAITAAALTRTGTASTNDQLVFASTVNISGQITLNGNSPTLRLLVTSSVLGTARTVTAAAVSVTNADFVDITGAGAGSWDLSAISGGSGDGGGNSNITFTPPTTQNLTMSTDKNYSDVTIWTSRVPLPQDSVTATGWTGGILTVDIPRLGKDINFSGATGATTLALPNGFTIYGSVNLTGVTTNGSGAGNGQLAGRGTHTITSAGLLASRGSLTVAAFGGTYTLQDAMTVASTLSVTAGTFNANNFNVTAAIIQTSGATTRAVTMGTGTWTITSTTATTVWGFAAMGGMTLSAASSTIVFANSTSNTRTFAGGGGTYGTFSYTLSGSAGTVQFTGSNTFDTLNIYDNSGARSVLFTAGTTTTVNNWNVHGNPTNMVTVASITAAAHTLAKASGIATTNYLFLTNSQAGGGASWYAGSGSVNDSGNLGWIFTDATISQTTTGVARIRTTRTQTQAGVARIRKVMSQDQPGTADILKILTDTIPGKANLATMYQAQQPGVASMSAVGSRDQLGTARILMGSWYQENPIDWQIPSIVL